MNYTDKAGTVWPDCQLVTEIRELEAEAKWLRENLDVKNAILALRDDENERLRDCFRIACEVLARDDIELDAYGHKMMIERMRRNERR
jgi:hypothetical protein